jgi:hypothetical protein
VRKYNIAPVMDNPIMIGFVENIAIPMTAIK